MPSLTSSKLPLGTKFLSSAASTTAAPDRHRTARPTCSDVIDAFIAGLPCPELRSCLSAAVYSRGNLRRSTQITHPADKPVRNRWAKSVTGNPLRGRVRCSGRLGVGVVHSPVVLDGRERVVEVVQQLLPLQVLRRPPELLRVILQPPPADQQNIPRRFFEATVKFEPEIAGDGGDERPRLGERRLERGLRAGPDIEHSNFENHPPTALHRRAR